MASLTLGGVTIRDDGPCYVIAELGHNHGGDVATAIRLIEAAADAGAHAVKFQCRDNGTLYSPALLDQPYDNENSYGATYGAHRAALELSPSDLADLRLVAAGRGVAYCATAFDERSADLLVALDVAAIKIASGGLTDTALLSHVASLGKPVILSTGGGTLKDISQAVSTLTRRSSDVAILHCTAAYPCDFQELNLRCIQTLKSEFPELVIGWSGHDSGIAMAVSAYTLGARILEKHFTLNRAMKGTDHAFSLEPAGLKKMCRDLERAHIALGDGIKRYYESERKPIAKMRRRPTPDGLRITGALDAIG